MASILIVDDDEDLAFILSDVLADSGHHVRVGRNGSDGLSMLDEQPLPDVIILDIEMPVLDGPGMAQQMFLLDAGKEEIPILLVSGSADLRAIARRVGTPYFAAKPCPLENILVLLRRALAEHIPPSPIDLDGGRRE